MFLEEMTRYLVRWNPVDVKEIEPLVVAYRPTLLQQIPQPYQELLRAGPDPASQQALPSPENTANEDGWSEWVIVDSKNPEKVAHNLRVLQREFEQALITCADGKRTWTDWVEGFASSQRLACYRGGPSFHQRTEDGHEFGSA